MVSSIKFENQKQAFTDLTRLRDHIFKQHCYVSIPMILVILGAYIIINLVMPQIEPPTPPEQKLCTLIQISYLQTLGYMRYFNDLTKQIMELKSQSQVYSSLKDAANQYAKPSVGMKCVSGSADGCDKFTALSSVAWQYQTNSNLFLTIDAILVCMKLDDPVCVAVPSSSPPLHSQEKNFINSSAHNLTSQVLPIIKYIQKTGMVYISYRITDSLFTVLRLTDFSTVLNQIASQIQLSFLSQYSLILTNPYYHKLVQKTNGNSKFEYEKQIVISLHEMQHQKQFLVFKFGYSTITYDLSFYMKLSCFAPFIFVIFLLCTEKSNITRWVQTNFSRKHLINELYKHTIKDIFMGIKPNVSNVLQRGATAEMFKVLSDLVDKAISPILESPVVEPHREGFKFIQKINMIIQKYKQHITGIMHAKFRHLLSNRFNIQSSINELTQRQNKIMKQLFARAQQLNITQSFFLFAYNAILLTSQKFQEFIQDCEVPMPQKLIQFFVRTNEIVHMKNQIQKKLIEVYPQNASTSNEADITQEDAFADENKEQLQIRIQVQIIPKYLSMLKALDKDNLYAEKLNLHKMLEEEVEVTQNIRCLLTRHNKSIRLFSK